jgi:hypothetical protein
MPNPYLDLVARLETRGGEATIKGPQGEDSNNLFNIKETRAGRAGYTARDKAEGSNDAYRVYASRDESQADMESLLARRYPEAFDAMQKPWSPESVTEFASGLKKRGYATDPNYVDKLVKLSGQVDGSTYVGRSSNRMKGVDAAVTEVVNSYVVRPQDERLANARREAANFTQRVAAEALPTIGEQFSAALGGNTDWQIFDGIKASLFGPKYPKEAGFVPDVSLLPYGAEGDLVNDYKQASSKAEADHVLEDFAEKQERMKTIMAGGTGTGVALAMLAEVPALSNLIPSVAAAKVARWAGYANSARLAAEGRTGAMIGAAIAENVASGTVVEAVRQGVTGQYSLADLGIAAAADVTFGLAQAGMGARQANNAIHAAAVRNEVDRYATSIEKAKEALGETATPEELVKHADNAYKQEIADVARAADTHTLPAERKLLNVAEEESQTSWSSVGTSTEPVKPADVDLTARFERSPLEANRAAFEPGGRWEASITDNTSGKYTKLADIEKLPDGMHFMGKTTPETRATGRAMQELAKRFMPDAVVTVNFAKAPYQGGFASAKVTQVSDKVAMIMVDPDLAPSQQIRSAVHEMGHIVFNRKVGNLPAKELEGLRKSFEAFVQEATGPTFDGNKARAMRFSATAGSQYAGKVLTPKPTSKYELNFDEYAAEQFVKYIEKAPERFGIAAKTVQVIKDAIERVVRLFKAAGREGIDVDASFEKFFNSAMVGEIADQASMPTVKAVNSVNAMMADPNIVRFGLSTLPVATDADRAQVKQIAELHLRAEKWAAKNPKDAQYMARVQNLADNNVFNVASTGLLMLKSDSPLVRMIASELLEDASGVQKGRKDTAAIAKYITERAIMGNAINDFQGAFGLWKKGRDGAGLWDDMVGGQHWDAFNKEVASEIEARRGAGKAVSEDPNIKAAADTLEAAYTRAATQQRKAKVLGWAALPESSVGYMPHKMSPQKVMALTNEQQQVLHSALTDQFITIEGWDMSFADELASKYMKRVRDRAAGDYGTVIGGHSQGAAEVVEDALIAMNLSRDEIKAHMKNYTKGAANFTKSRIDLDLNMVHDTGTGPFRLLDIFETNQIELLRSQAGRASGDVALAKYGVYGRPGLQLLRDAMRYGQDGAKASVKDFESFDQIAAEFMNDPFGTHAGKFMERAMAANTLVRLGGVVFNQLAETINGVFHVGALRTAESVASIPRLRKEIHELAAGRTVDNPIIGSIELAGGAEFGTDSYKFVMPFDSPDHAYPTYGKDTLTVTDRLLRGGNHLQAKLSGWRTIHSAQQRGMAEQIVHKMMRYVREGKDDKALRDFGITEDVQRYLRDELDKVATFEGDRLVRFDITKLEDTTLREQVIQSVWRGTAQIIQGTYIGERGKWAHDGFLKLLTQFRGFGLTSMEKQWGRQRNQHGSYAAFGMAIGAMSMAWPIYAARVYASSIGRPDQQGYIDERMTPQNVARATLNYIAMSGMAGDFIDLLTAVSPDAVKEATGFNPMGSTGKEADMVGNYVLPSASLVNDGFKWLQSPFELQDAAKIMPMSRLPFMVPLMNATKD